MDHPRMAHVRVRLRVPCRDVQQRPAMQDISINANEAVTLIIMFAATAMQAYHDAIWGRSIRRATGWRSAWREGANAGSWATGRMMCHPITVTWT